MSEPTLELEVPEAAAGMRLDHYLTDVVADQTRSALRRWIAAGRVALDGEPATKPGISLRAGMLLRVEAPPPPARQPLPEAIPLEVAHEDEELIVVIKPAGLVVHPGHGCPNGTLVNALLGRGTPLAAVGGADRPGIVHRLDRETSGLLVVAKTDTAHRALSTALARRQVTKHYVGLVWGRPDPPAARIERSIGRSRSDPTRMAVTGTRGRMRYAATSYRTRRTIPGFTLLDLELHTGRTHQLRVHLQSIHHAVAT